MRVFLSIGVLCGGVLELVVEPRDTAVRDGGSAVLDCAAQSSEHNRTRIMVQWQDEHGQPVTYIGDALRSQLANNSLYIARVVDSDTTGAYRCRATLPNGWSVLSRAARVSVARLDGWVAQPSDISVNPGERAYLACKPRVAGGPAAPAAHVKWLKDGRALYVDDLRMAVLPGGALEIDDVQPRDSGSYRCNGSLLGETSLSSEAQLTVVDEDLDDLEPRVPVFVAEPGDTSAAEGDIVTLECAANGRPRPLITWLKDGSAVDMADLDTRYSLVGAAGGSLQVCK